jgi:predicted HTH transcriptional regulator
MSSMSAKVLLAQIVLGEDSTRQFKADVKSAESLASEMAAFANTGGGTIFIGVADDGSTPGLSGQRHDPSLPLRQSHRDHQPNNLTVEKIRTGNSNIRNPILVSFVAKGLLPYHGLGSGIKRALEKWPAIDFVDDHDGCLFTATVHRKPVEELELADKGAITGQVVDLSGHPDPINDLLTVLRTDPSADYATLAEQLEVSEATVKRNIQKLKQQNRIRRIGSKKTGHWEVLE